MRRFFVVVAATLAIGSCSDAVALQTDLVRINVLPDALEIVNLSKQPVYYMVAERNTLALLNWLPCTDPSSCDGIKIGGSAVVPYDDIVGYTPGAAEAVVFHWHLIADGAGAFRTDSLRSTIVQLHHH